MMQPLLMGIDIGTSACKVAVFTRDGQAVSWESASYAYRCPRPGWAEQDPSAWWKAVCRAVRGVLAKGAIRPASIAGVGVCGQSWAPVYLDGKGETLANAPLWLDTRSGEECRAMNEAIGEEGIFRVAGNPLQPMYATGKVLWLKKHFPDVFEKIYKILSSNGYIVYKLCGQMSMDVSQGYSWHCFDTRQGRWDAAMSEKLGVPRKMLPEICACSQAVGRISHEAAARTGLAAGTKVVAGGLDAACAALGAGVIHDGECQEQGGQAGGMSVCIQEYKADPRLIVSAHVVPGTWILQGGTTGGGGVMRWLEKEFAGYERAREGQVGKGALEQLNELAAKVSPGSDGVVFLPYMSGERTPIWDPNAKGVFYGLDYSKTKSHMVRAAMEGVAYSVRHNLDVAEEAGCSVKELRATGGAANSLLWTQIKADIARKDFVLPQSDMATALGTALLTGVGVGAYRDFEEAVALTIKEKRVHKADESRRAAYEKNYRVYRQLYQALKGIMEKNKQLNMREM